MSDDCAAFSSRALRTRSSSCLTPPTGESPDNEELARCRVRTYKNCIQHQQLTSVDQQIDPQTCAIEKQQLTHLVNAWPTLPASLKNAILMIAGSGDAR